MIVHDSKAWPKAGSRRKAKKESACSAPNGYRIGGFGKNLQTNAITDLTFHSGGDCHCNRTLLEITYRWKAGLKVVEATSKPWPALPTKEEEMVEKILLYIYLSRDNLLRFTTPKKEGEP
jgi:hypothetical protein